ncbi:MAG TPA: amino acid permease [Thermoanaerobaculia bacterium]|jgi:amino acid transporter|nr:amino acid permease [Thermoanaerobaculia bacterium]
MHDDETYLASLGYRQQLFREMGGFSNFAISFSIISILTGAVLLYGYGLKFAGPIVNSVGWPIVSFFTLAVAASMAEIASAYPTAGGLYFWSRRLGGRGWAWLTAWLNMIGQVTITGGINIAASIYLIGAATRIFDLRGALLTNWYFQLAVMIAILIPQVIINVYGIRLTARLNDISVWWHIAGVLLITLALTFFGKHHNPLAFLFSFAPTVNAFEASSTLVVGNAAIPSPLFRIFPSLAALYQLAPPALLFVLALLQAQWTYTGYDASAHVAEETKMARLNSAWGIFLSVAVSAVVGYVMLMVLTWCIPNGDVAATAADPYPVLYVIANNLGSFMTNLIAVIIGGAMWLCGLASVTSMGRMWYAFARDDGMPGAAMLKRVSTNGTPVNAIVVTSILSVLVCLYAAAFYVVTSISTIALYLAYVIPIFLNLRNRIRGRGEHMTRDLAPWSLGRWGPVINAIAIAWCAFIAIVFMLPPNELVLWTMLAFTLGLYVMNPERAKASRRVD